MPAEDSLLPKAVALPEHYLITGRSAGTATFPSSLETELQRGRKLIQLRMPGWTPARLKPLAESTAGQCRKAGALLLINEHIGLAAAIENSGVHLKSEQLLQRKTRPLAADRLVAASCHDEAEIRHACDLGLDFICLSPVLETRSHPGATALGWERFEQLCRLSTLPVYALGGMTDFRFARIAVM